MDVRGAIIRENLTKVGRVRDDPKVEWVLEGESFFVVIDFLKVRMLGVVS